MSQENKGRKIEIVFDNQTIRDEIKQFLSVRQEDYFHRRDNITVVMRAGDIIRDIQKVLVCFPENLLATSATAIMDTFFEWCDENNIEVERIIK